MLRGVPASVGVIEIDQSCFELAMPPEIYSRYRLWNARKVVVTGQGYSRPDSDDLVWYFVKDRQVARGGCGPGSLVVYVETIRRL